MNTPAQFRYCWTTGPGVSVPNGWDAISDADFGHGGVKGPRIESMAEPGGQMPAWAWDLLQAARTAYVADKKSKRGTVVDGWTRDIRICVPARDPSRWDGPASALLRNLLQTLTADQWDAAFQPMPPVWARQGRIMDDWTAGEVALFSGGLDSSAFAADLAKQPGGDVLLVMFYDPATKARQEAVFRRIKDIKNRPLHLRVASQMVVGGPLERSSRSRGLLYIATAVYMAAGHGATQVLLPENGQLALNLPLTPSRPAACSTRSVHPHTLDLLNRLITALGGDVTVANPLSDRTKGEVCELALEAGLTSETLYATVSCSHPPHTRNAYLPFHCGYCYPCLVRRAGLWHALGADSTGYQHNPWQLPDRDERTEDLLALLLWLNSPFTSMDLIADMPLPAGIDPVDLMPVQHRARRELTVMLNSVLSENGPYRNRWQLNPSAEPVQPDSDGCF
jgi:7-cyano-7-deazaguanine synthase in queuosine biosynthesis